MQIGLHCQLLLHRQRADLLPSALIGLSPFAHNRQTSLLYRGGGLHLGEALALYPRDLNGESGTVRIHNRKSQRYCMVYRYLYYKNLVT